MQDSNNSHLYPTQSIYVSHFAEPINAGSSSDREDLNASPTSTPASGAPYSLPVLTPVAGVTSGSVLNPVYLLPSLEAITAENAHNLKLLDYVGRGMISGIAWSPDAEQVAIASSSGIYLIDVITWGENRLSDTSSSMVAYSPDGSMLASVEGSRVQFWSIANQQALFL